DLDAVGNGGQRAAERVEQLELDAGLDVAALGAAIGRRRQARPATGEPVRLVGLVARASLELAFEQRVELVDLVVQPRLIDHA
nr:hypothetical protein [Tanacetum cinerariifolium]